MINQQFSIDSEHIIKKIFIVILVFTAYRTFGNITHSIQPRFIKLFCISFTNSPEICNRLMMP